MAEVQYDCNLKHSVRLQLLSKVDYCFYAIYLTELVLRFAVYGVLVLKSHWKLGH